MTTRPSDPTPAAWMLEAAEAVHRRLLNPVDVSSDELRDLRAKEVRAGACLIAAAYAVESAKVEALKEAAKQYITRSRDISIPSQLSVEEHLHLTAAGIAEKALRFALAVFDAPSRGGPESVGTINHGE